MTGTLRDVSIFCGRDCFALGISPGYTASTEMRYTERSDLSLQLNRHNDIEVTGTICYAPFYVSFASFSRVLPDRFVQSHAAYLYIRSCLQ